MKTIEKLKRNGIDFDLEDIIRICQKYFIIELSIFGSAIREDFTEDSDVDILIIWKDYLELNQPYDCVDVIEDLRFLFKRNVDVVDKLCIQNPIRRKHILSTAEVIYANL